MVWIKAAPQARAHELNGRFFLDAIEYKANRGVRINQPQTAWNICIESHVLNPLKNLLRVI